MGAGSVRCRAWSAAIAVAAHAEEAGRSQPQEHVMRQCGLGSVTLDGLLDQLIRPLQERLWDREAEGLGGLEVDLELKRRNLPDRYLAGNDCSD